MRIDVPGLTPGSYDLTITMGSSSFTIKGIDVLAHDRSGFAHYKYTDGVGAYNDDGTLKANAKVLYVTEENKNTVTVKSKDNTTVTGIGNILNSKGYADNGNKGILKKLADDGTPLVVRIVGRVTAPEGVTEFDSTKNGGSVGDNGFMCRMQDANNVTIEGIGVDAVVDGWGFHFIAETKGYGKGFEMRNLEFRNVPEDCVGMEGKQEGTTITVPVQRCWIHNCEFYVPHIDNPAESDKAEGDGACDFKRGMYMTMDYCYYEKYHKTNLIGASDSNLQFHITWHHNYYKECESRGPLARQANIHIYNTIYDSQTSYCQNPRANSYIFSEYNRFINSKAPGRVTSGGVIKSYQDSFENVRDDQHATVVTDKNEKVSSSCQYANFDTNSSMSYIPDGNYQLDTDMAVMEARIKAYTGTMKPAAEIESAPSVPDPGPTTHSHKWSDWTKVKDATCTTAGSEKRTCQNEGCSIGTETRTIAALGHSWGGWVRTKDPDCIHTGSEERTCDTCKEKETQDVAATGKHVYGEDGKCTTSGCTASIDIGGGDTPAPAPAGAYVHNFTASGADSEFYTIDGNLSKDKGTVTYNGMTLTQCLKMESSTQVTFTAPAGGGSLTLVFVESAPTIKLDGTKYTGSGGIITIDAVAAGSRTLTKADGANLFYMVFTPAGAPEHECKFENYTVTKEPTCSQPGEKTPTCSVAGCGKTDTQVIPATAKHVYASANSVYCTQCGQNKNDPSNVHTSHSFGSWKVTTTATCIQEGEETRTCGNTKCGATETQPIPKTAHTWVGEECSVCHTSKPTTGSFTKVGGWFETAYAQWAYMEGASSYKAYYKKASEADSAYKQVDDPLIRQYPSYLRVDVPGIAAGEYVIKVEPMSGGQPIEGAAMTTPTITVRAHDRTGYAYFAGGSPGAYKADGTPKANARVIYVTEETKDTVTLGVITDKSEVQCKGIQNIIAGYKKRKDSRPLIIRIIGNITDPANMPKGDLLVDGVGNGMTIEGIGTDAVCNGFGVCLKGSTNVEVRNLGFMNCNSSEGDSLSLQQDNDHIWTHNNDIFYGHAGSDKDQIKGDGSLDTKTSTYVTHSYNHLWDSGKTHLQGMKEESTDNYITYHHNWYDHSDSRHPRIRTCTVHIYNNYFDGVSKYGVGMTMGGSAFVENNYFRGTSKPMMISMQGTDIAAGAGTFSGENGGVIKAFNNIMVGDGRTISYKTYSAANPTEFDAYEAGSRNEQVPTSVVAKQGGTTYNNFDTNSKLIYDSAPQSPDTVVAEVEQWSGRMEGGDIYWEFNDATDDTDYSVIPEFKAMLTNYKGTLVKVGGTVSNGGATVPTQCTHTTTRWVTTIAATCTNPGIKTEVCVSCGVSLNTDSIPVTGHSLQWVVTLQPTCGTAGEETSTCSVCGAAFGDPRAVPATGNHIFEGGTCTECGASEGATPPTPVDPDPPAPTNTTYILRAKEDVYNKLPITGDVDKNGNPIYIYTAAATVPAGTENYFTLQCTSKTKIDYSSDKTWDDNYTSDYRINFGGAAATDSSSILFTTKNPATVKVWWVQGGQDGDREIVILDKATGKEVTASVGDSYTKNLPYFSALSLTQPGTYALGSAPGNNYIFKVEVTETQAGDTPAQPLETTALSAAISAANTALSTAEISHENGTDMLPTQLWVSQKTATALTDAIATAQTVLQNSAATQGQVDQAVTDLNDAVEIFKAARQPGTKTPPNPAELKAAITAAQAELDGILKVSTDAAFVKQGEEWTTQAAKDEYQSIIDAVTAVANQTTVTETELLTASSRLSAATANFRQAVKQGTAAHCGTLGQLSWGVDAAGKLKLSGTGTDGEMVIAAIWDANGNFLEAKLLKDGQTTAQLGSFAKVKLMWLSAKYAPKCAAAIFPQ